MFVCTSLELAVAMPRSRRALEWIQRCRTLVGRVRGEAALVQGAGRAAVETGICQEAWTVRLSGEAPDAACNLSESVRKDGPAPGRNEGAQGGLIARLKQDKEVILDDPAAQPPQDPLAQRLRQRGLRAMAALPLRRVGRPVAGLVLCSRERGAFVGEEPSLLRQVSAHLSQGLSRTDGEAAGLRQVNELGSAISQQIGQPLTAAANYGQLALQALDSGGAAGVRDFLEKGLGQLQRIHHLTDQLRAILNQRELWRQPTPLGPLLQEAVERLAAERGGQVEVPCRLALDPSLPPIPADAGQLREAVLHLLRNAVAACTEDQDRSGEILIRTRLDHAAEIAVADEGPGLAGTTPETLMQPFMSHHPERAGLGLPIARAIAELHGGSLALESRPEGRGLVARLRLPWTDQEGGP